MAKMAKRGLKNGFGEGVNNQRPPKKATKIHILIPFNVTKKNFSTTKN